MIDLPVKIAYDLLSPELLNSIDFHMVAVPRDLVKLENLPLGRITEIVSYDDDHASDTPNSISMTVQVDVWASSIEQLNEFNKKIHEIFIKNNWSCVANGIDLDPDFDETPRLYKRFRTKKLINLNF